MSDDSDDEKVGYGRPPTRTQFQKGRSGNPSGKSRKQRSFADDVSRALQERVVVTKDGRTRRMRNSLIQGDRIIRGAQIMDTL